MILTKSLNLCNNYLSQESFGPCYNYPLNMFSYCIKYYSILSHVYYKQDFFVFALRNWFLIDEYTSTFPGYNFSFIFHLQLHVKSNCSRAKNSQIHAALTNSNSIFNYMPGIRRCIYYCKRKIIVISNFGYDNVSREHLFFFKNL